MRIGVMLAPGLAARQAAQRRFARQKHDSNNFADPNQLLTLLTPYRLVSFDLFDTLVWRRISIQDVHRKTAEFGQRMIVGDDGPLPAGLLLHCRGRHQEMVKTAGMRPGPQFRNEVDLAQVFDTALAPWIADPVRRADMVEALIAFEIGTERKVLAPDVAMQQLLVRLRAQGKTLILVSDMYLRERWLRQILDDHGLSDLFDHVFVSCDTGLTKNSGHMFDHVDAVLGSGDWRRMHLGDNWTNDVTRPRERGWDALHYLSHDNEIRKDRLERETRFGLHDRPSATRGVIRTIEASDDPAQGLVRLMSAGFLGFSRQVLQTAVQGRFDRVLFLTRDGTLFGHLARQVLADFNAPTLDCPPLEDLAFSRRMGVLLTCPPRDDPEWQDYLRFNVRWMQDRDPTLDGLLRSFALSPDDLGPAGMRDGATLLDDVLADPDSAAMLDDALQTRRRRVIDYLQQRGLFDPAQKLLLVDIGYSGTVLKSLSEHLWHLDRTDAQPGARLTMMMFAANRFLAGNLDRLHPRCTLLDPVVIDRHDWRARAAAFNYAWLEPFAVDRDRGSLRDYAADDQGRLHPVFGPPSGTPGPVDHARIRATARDIDGVLRASAVSDAAVGPAIAAAIVRRFSVPGRATLAAVDGLTHQAGLSEIAEGGLLGRVRPWRLRSDLSRCLAEDRWVQGSMSASHLGWLNPTLNRIIGLISR